MRRFSLRREIALGLGVYGLYLAVRSLVLARGGRARGRVNARRVARAEEALGVHFEPALQRAFLRMPRLVHGLNAGYALFNVTLTVGWLVFLFRRRDRDYHRLSRACLLAYAGAQPAFLLFPTSPPRVLEGFVDTFSEVSGFDIEHPLLLRFYNPVAAMPSLHVAFATVTAAAMADRAESTVVKVFALAYAPLVSLVVTATGNHFVLDSVAGAVLGAGARKLA